MRRMTKWSLGLFGLAMAAGSCLGQAVEPTKFYKMEFVVKEVEGTKVVNSRAYFMTVPVEAPGQTSQSGSIRTGSRVPVTSTGGRWIQLHRCRCQYRLPRCCAKSSRTSRCISARISARIPSSRTFPRR